MFHLFYSSVNFTEGLVVSCYFIYPDLVKSEVFTFNDLGDGIYAAEITQVRKPDLNTEKYGIVVKEDGVVKKFDLVQMYY